MSQCRHCGSTDLEPITLDGAPHWLCVTEEGDGCGALTTRERERLTNETP